MGPRHALPAPDPTRPVAFPTCHCSVVRGRVQLGPGWVGLGAGSACRGPKWPLIVPNGPRIIYKIQKNHSVYRLLLTRPAVSGAGRPVASSIHHSALSVLHAASSIEHPASSIQHPASSIQHATFSIQHAAFSIQHPVFSIQHQNHQISSQPLDLDHLQNHEVQRQPAWPPKTISNHSIMHSATSIQHAAPNPTRPGPNLTRPWTTLQ